MKDEEIISSIYMLQKEIERHVDELRRRWIGKRIIILKGKYSGRHAQIKDVSYSFSANPNIYSSSPFNNYTLNVYIYRADKRTGFKGRELFIDDHAHEYQRYEHVRFL